MSERNGSNERSAFVREYLHILNEALLQACRQWGPPVDEAIRASLGYFILREARAGERDPRVLAEIAVTELRANPGILHDVGW